METSNDIRAIDIRAYALIKGVFIYEIAKEFGIATTSMSRKLHSKNIKPYEKEYILKLIDKIAERKAAARDQALEAV